ncbi:MAG: hypothetical protein M0Q91_10055 [Methanoregula sp.]|jgi:hypothetical protein|nr:hypothetical protein [Methanoregula sp.]
MANFRVVGIGKTTQEARLNPAESISITTAELAGQSTGQLFVAIEDNDSTIPNGMGLRVNEKTVCIKDNERWIQTNTVQPPKTGYPVLPFDFPMRLLTGVEKPVTFTLVFDAGVIENEQFLKYGESKEFYLTVTGDELETPVYNQEKDGD